MHTLILHSHRQTDICGWTLRRGTFHLAGCSLLHYLLKQRFCSNYSFLWNQWNYPMNRGCQGAQLSTSRRHPLNSAGTLCDLYSGKRNSCCSQKHYFKILTPAPPQSHPSFLKNLKGGTESPAVSPKRLWAAIQIWSKVSSYFLQSYCPSSGTECETRKTEHKSV